MKRSRRFWLVAIPLFAAALMLAAPFQSPAADLDWNGNGGFFFEDTGNWSPAQSPTASDNLTFGSGASKFTLVMAGSRNANDLLFNGGAYSIEGGASSLLTSTNSRVDSGVLDVTGSNTDWNNTNDIQIGDLATGTLNIGASANVDHRGLILGDSALGNGTVNLSGGATLGSANVGSIGRIGLNGTGVMNVSGGARSDMSSAVFGFFTGATGTLNVSGVGTDFVTNGYDIQVGHMGTGHLNVTSGGRIRTLGSVGSNGNLTAGHGPDGIGTITLNGGIADSDNRTYIGRGGTGTFTATNGSAVTSELQFILGDEADAVGTATFDNSDLSVANSNHDLIVGASGVGQMAIQNGSNVDIPDQVLIGFTGTSTGDNRLEITGGSTLSAGHDIFAGQGGRGTFILSGGSAASGRSLTLGGSTGSHGTVLVDGANTTANLEYLWVGNSGTADATISGGSQVNVNTPTSADVSIAVGDDTTSNGTLTITGTGTQVSANKRMEVGGSNNEVGGAGTLNITAGGELTTAGATIGVRSASSAGAGGVGTVHVSGSGSVWQSTNQNPLIVGQIGEGHLNVTSGGLVNVDSNLTVGDTNNSAAGAASVTVSGSDGSTPSTVNVQGILSVGNDRAATMTISDGAVLNTGTNSASRAYIGDSTTSTGALMTVDNATWNHLGDRIVVGRNGGSAAAPSTLQVVNGGTVTTERFMVSDDSAGSHGLVEISGVGSSLTASVFSIIGDAGPGTVHVTDGGVFNVTNSLDVSGSGTGTLMIDGMGNSDTAVNVFGEAAVGRSNGSVGHLTVRGEGKMTTGNLRVAEVSGSTGVVDVLTGGTLKVNAGSLLTVGGAATADGGAGMLRVQGGVVTSDVVTVRSSGSVMLNSGTLRIATLNRLSGSSFDFHGEGELAFMGNKVLGAGQLADIFNDDATLDGIPTQGMTLTVDGTAALDAPLRLNGGTFSVGSISDLSNLDWDSGTLRLTAMDVNIQSGGLFGNQLLLQPGQNLAVTQSTTNNGLINATGTTLSFSGGLMNNADLVFVDSSVDGPVTSPAGSTITIVGNADFAGLVSGAGNFYGPGSANFNGGYNPGDSPAVVMFEGDLVSTDSLFIEIGGNDNSMTAEFDQLLVDGSAVIGGLLDVSLIDLGSGTYVPQLGDSFAIVTAADGLSGDFGQFDLPALAGGLGWQVNSDSSTLWLNVVNGGMVNGDFDNDGDFDGVDIDALVATIAGGSSNSLFDMNGDGSVNQADLADWLAVAGAANNPSGNAYLYGDANLDGTVDVSDFNLWNSNKFSNVAAWTRGDFTADGSIDVSDFNNWNSNKFQFSDSTVVVPEPNGLMIACLALGTLSFFRRRK